MTKEMQSNFSDVAAWWAIIILYGKLLFVSNTVTQIKGQSQCLDVVFP